MQPKQIFVIPAEGMKIFDPLTKQFIAASGQYVPDNVYWRKHINWKDVALGEPSAEASALEAPSAPSAA